MIYNDDKNQPLRVLVARHTPLPPDLNLSRRVADWTLAELGLRGKPRLRTVPLGWTCSGASMSAVGRTQEEAYERWKRRVLGHPNQAQQRVDSAITDKWFKEHDRLIKNAVARYRRLERRSPEWREYEISG